MRESLQHIKFNNQQNLNATFDLIELETLFQRKDLDHSIDKIHLVEFYILIFVEQGNGKHTIDFTNYPIEKGSILTIRKDQIHKFTKNKSIKGILLLFTDDFLVSYLEKLAVQKTMQLFNELFGIPKIQLNPTEYEEIASIIIRIKEEYFNTNDEYSLGIIRSELHILITKLFRIKNQNHPKISTKKYLNEFITLQNLVETHANKTNKVHYYAKMMGCSTKTLNNITKNILHKTAKEFVDEICTKQIKRLLINTELSVKEIAYASGFEETTNFYKYFKRQTNTTPERFRISS